MLSYGPIINQARKVAKKLHPSRKWQPLRQVGTDDGAEEWMNDLYCVRVKRGSLSGGIGARIGISNNDGSARHDWRDFQRIKNQLVGEEWEAVELYPAESRLNDPSNFFLLWCAPSFPFGFFVGRRIAHPENCVAPQRGWPEGDKPETCGLPVID